MHYDAFVSYSHGADARLAPVLQRALHRFAKPWWKARAVSVFRDETSLAAAHSLPETLTKALDESAFFILMASPAAARSKWVADECEYFAKHRDAKRMLIVLSEGEIAWDSAAGDFDWARTDALPARLKGVFQAEPLYVDLRWARPLLDRSDASFNERDPRFLAAVARLSAALRGVSLEAIAGEELRQHRKTRRVVYASVSAIALLAVGATAGAWLATENAREADRQRSAAERQQRLAEERRVEADAQRKLAEDRRAEAEAQRKIAEERRVEAEREKAEAERQRVAAEKATRVAQEEEAKAKVAREKEEAERIQAQMSQSRMLVGRAQDAYARGDGTLGDLLLIEALPRRTPTGPSRVETIEATRLAHERLGNAPRLIVLKGHGVDSHRAADEVGLSSIAFSADGRHVLTAGADRTARVWAAETGALLHVLRGHESHVTSAVFSPDGKYIATTSYDRTVRLWSGVDGKAHGSFRNAGDFLRVVFSADSTRLLIASNDRMARILEVASGREIAVLRGHEHTVLMARFSRDGKYVVTSSDDQTARIWEADSGRQLQILRHSGSVSWSEFDPTGEFIVTASEDKLARVWEAKSGRELHVLRGHAASVAKAVFDPSGERIATASDDMTARLFDAKTGREIAALRGHEAQVRDIVFSADGKRLLTGSNDQTARIWDGKDGRSVRVLGGHGRSVGSVAFHPDGLWVATESDDGLGRLFELDARSHAIATGASFDDAGAAFLARSGRRFITLHWDKRHFTMRLWEVGQGREPRTLGPSKSKVMSAAFSADETRILTMDEDGNARIWNAETLEELATIETGSAIKIGGFDPDGKRIVLALRDGTAQVWDVGERKKIAVLKSDLGGMEAASFSPDGKLILTAALYTAHVWDAERHHRVAELKGHTGLIRTAEFGPDSKHVVTVSDDKTARTWDAVSGRELRVFETTGEWIGFATYDPDGRLVAIVERYGTIRLWDTVKGEAVMVLQGDHMVLSITPGFPFGAVRFSANGKWLIAVNAFGVVHHFPRPVVLDTTILAELLALRTYRDLTNIERRDNFLEERRPVLRAPSCRSMAGDPYDPDNAESGMFHPQKGAIERCRAELAERRGDPQLSYLLARALMAESRNAEARPHLEAALKGDYAMAHYLEAMAHLRGTYGPQDAAKGIASLKRAMERGVALAAYELAAMMWWGAGKPPDPVVAIALWERAAAAGNPHSHEVLAELSLHGVGTKDTKAGILFRFALASRLFADAGAIGSAELMRVRKGNAAQDLGAGELRAVAERLAAWTSSDRLGRLRD